MELLNALMSNLWAVFLIILFFGGSIFLHELGHFLAARWRGMHVERFSIGFGPRMFGWKGKDGVEYRVSWLPLGGYVALPQLADLKGLEGELSPRAAALPSAGYADKMIVAVAGAVFNLIFAFVLATLLWFLGQPTSSDQATTQIGYVSPTIELEDHTKVTSPAKEAGLQVGDIVREIDGRAINNWQELMQTLVTGADRAADGRRKTVFKIEREGKFLDVILYPRLSGDEKMRKVGIAAAYPLVIHSVTAGSLAEKIGLKASDRLVSLDGIPVLNIVTLVDHLTAQAAQTVRVQVTRAGTPLTLDLPPRDPKSKEVTEIGAAFTTDNTLVHEGPLDQFSGHVSMTWRTLSSVVNPSSDIGINKLSGPVGIIRVFHLAAQADIRIVLWFTILVNINLAIFNLLPIPVLDGGHMLFATIGKIRGRSLPANFIAATQSVFVVLLFSMILYVTVFDVRRLTREFRSSSPPASAEAAPASK
ncbi:MAG: site-2 protease family protein [Opitutaceae bacterium]|nr:site-2 protease family protein [Opitutaceae bacterium]